MCFIKDKKSHDVALAVQKEACLKKTKLNTGRRLTLHKRSTTFKWCFGSSIIFLTVILQLAL